MNLIKHASELNNLGAHLIIQGDLGKATAAFQSALAIMKNASTPVGSNDSEDQERNAARDHSHSFRAFVGEIEVSSNVAQRNDSDIYNIPFVLEERLIPQQDIALPLYSAIILFNLGLSLHDESLTGREVCLKQATHIYRMSLQILESVSQQCPSAVVVAVAALNNKAAIHFELCEYTESKRCWVVLSQLFASAQAVMHVAMDATALGRIFMNFQMSNFPSAAGAA